MPSIPSSDDRPAAEPHRRFVLVTGPPASGKSTVAPGLARRLGLPLVAKDEIKDALMSVLPVPDIAASRQIGRASVVAMFAVAASSPIGAVLESNLSRTISPPEVVGLGGRVVEVFCRCDRSVALDRYRRRAGGRSAGHFDTERTDDEIWNPEIAEPVAGGWPVIEVDTNHPIDLADLVRRVDAAATP